MLVTVQLWPGHSVLISSLVLEELDYRTVRRLKTGGPRSRQWTPTHTRNERFLHLHVGLGDGLPPDLIAIVGGFLAPPYLPPTDDPGNCNVLLDFISTFEGSIHSVCKGLDHLLDLVQAWTLEPGLSIDRVLADRTLRRIWGVAEHDVSWDYFRFPVSAQPFIPPSTPEWTIHHLRTPNLFLEYCSPNDYNSILGVVIGDQSVNLTGWRGYSAFNGRIRYSYWEFRQLREEVGEETFLGLFGEVHCPQCVADTTLALRFLKSGTRTDWEQRSDRCRYCRQGYTGQNLFTLRTSERGTPVTIGICSLPVQCDPVVGISMSRTEVCHCYFFPEYRSEQYVLEFLSLLETSAVYRAVVVQSWGVPAAVFTGRGYTCHPGSFSEHFFRVLDPPARSS
jgi:hypothetical protein